jgi:hypothetical protein
MRAVLALLDVDPVLRTTADAIVDRARSVTWLAEVFPIKPERGLSRVKFLAGGDAAEGWDVVDAQAYWRDVHPVVARTAPSVWEPLTRYVQFHGVPAPEVAERMCSARGGRCRCAPKWASRTSVSS